MVKMSQIKGKGKMNINTSVTTSPKPGKRPGYKPAVAKRLSSIQKKKALSRKSMPNLDNTEDYQSMTGGGGMNDENALRKIRRSNQGL